MVVDAWSDLRALECSRLSPRRRLWSRPYLRRSRRRPVPDLPWWSSVKCRATGNCLSLQAEQVLLANEPLPDAKSTMPKGDYSTLSTPAPTSPPVAPETEAPRTDPIDFSELAEETEDLPVASRDEFSTTYQRADGSMMLHASEEPMNVKRSDGSWTKVKTEARAEQHRLGGAGSPAVSAIWEDGRVCVAGDLWTAGGTSSATRCRAPGRQLARRPRTR